MIPPVTDGQWLVVTGNVADGFAHYGPFADFDAAQAFAHRADDWTIVSLLTPEDDADSPEAIRALRAEAAEAGDLKQVDVCDLALAGDDGAIAECARVILNARAQE